MKQLLITICLFSFSIITEGQGSIGWTEQQIRDEYSVQKNTDIKVDYVSGQRNIVVINNEATASFNINTKTSLCDRSMIKFNKKELLTKYVEAFNNQYKIIVKGNSWETMLRGHLIKIEVRYLTKIQATCIVFYEVN